MLNKVPLFDYYTKIGNNSAHRRYMLTHKFSFSFLVPLFYSKSFFCFEFSWWQFTVIMYVILHQWTIQWRSSFWDIHNHIIFISLIKTPYFQIRWQSLNNLAWLKYASTFTHMTFSWNNYVSYTYTFTLDWDRRVNKWITKVKSDNVDYEIR